jgi:hypothetical protein
MKATAKKAVETPCQRDSPAKEQVCQDSLGRVIEPLDLFLKNPIR